MPDNKIIGGEFECSPQDEGILCGSCSNLSPYTYSSGRAAFYHILKLCRETLAASVVYLPDYLCVSIIDMVEKAEMRHEFYPLGNDLLPSSAGLENTVLGGVVVIIDYFGIVDSEPLVARLKSRRPDLVIVKDCVQAPYNINKESKADFQFTSFRKAFAVPDGSWVLTCRKMFQPALPSRFSGYKIAASLLKNFRTPGYYDDRIYLDLYEQGEALIDEDIDNGDMSRFTKTYLSHLDWRRMGILRRRNTKIILDGLRSLGISTLAPIGDTAIPLFVPVYLDNRNAVRKAMFANNIFLPVHWPIEKCDKFLHKGRDLADHELSIIVDQRYNVEDMMRILEILEKSYK